MQQRLCMRVKPAFLLPTHGLPRLITVIAGAWIFFGILHLRAILEGRDVVTARSHFDYARTPMPAVRIAATVAVGYATAPSTAHSSEASTSRKKVRDGEAPICVTRIRS